MRIAINTLPLRKTKVGMGKYIVELVNAVPKNDKDSEYIVYVSKHNKSFFDLKQPNVIVREISDVWTRGGMRLLWEQILLPFELVLKKVSIYHAPGFVLPLLKFRNIKYVVTIADLTFFSHPQHHINIKNIYFGKMIPLSVKKADRVITISESTKNDIIERTLCSPEKVQTIYLGVDSIFKGVAKKEQVTIKKKYALPDLYILFVGMLEPRKNVIGLIRAYAGLKEKKGHKLVIVGKKGWKYEEIFDVVSELNLEQEVLFLGFVPDEDLPGLYSGASCFVYPSFYEGFGIPIIEAMACKCPVITSGNSSMKEISGDAALLINPYEYTTIRDAITMMLGSKKKRSDMVRKGEAQAKKFSWARMAKETVAVYHEGDHRQSVEGGLK